MSEKRKDNKGRILKTGESQRKDLIYQYRYTDIHGKRQTIYSSDLKELREKEKMIEGIIRESYFDGENAIPVMVTAFGDIVIHDRTIGKLVNLLYRYRDLEVFGEHFFTDLFSQEYLSDNIKNKQYDTALEKYGSLAYDECFGYVPLLGLGGKERIKNIQKVKIKEHIELITQMVGKME